MKHRACVALLALGLICVGAPLAAFAETVRNILPPPYISDPSSYFTYGFNYTRGSFFLSPLFQDPTTCLPIGGTPVEYAQSYDAYPNTGLGPLTSTYQRGPCHNNNAQSTFQLTGYQGGMLMRGFDSPYPSANGKHTVWVYSWADPVHLTPKVCPAPDPQHPRPLLFQQTTNPNDQNDGLVIQSNVTVQQFDAWNISDSGPPHADDVAQVAFVVYLCDTTKPTQNVLQYVIYLYQDNACTKTTCTPDGDGGEGAKLAEGAYYLVSSIQRPSVQPHVLTTTRSDSGGVFSNSTWPYTSPFFRIYITPWNLGQAVSYLNTNYGQKLSTDVLNYTLAQVALNSEVDYANNMDTFVFGVSFNGFGVFEIKP